MSSAYALNITTPPKTQPNKTNHNQTKQLKAVDELVGRTPLTQPEIEAKLGVPLGEVFAGEPSPLRVLGVVKGEGLKLGDRAAHVYSEAARVYAFRDAAEVRVIFAPF
jgi:N-acetylgalactosamine kinase